MSKIATTLNREIRGIIPPTIFFFIVFHIVALNKALMLEQYAIEPKSSATATIGALIVAKAILIADKLPFVNYFPNRPLMYNAIWKTFVYGSLALLFRYAEELIPLVSRYGSLAVANRHLVEELVWPHFWAVQIWLFVLLFLYCAAVELIRVLGGSTVKEMFFGQKAGGAS